MISEDFLLVQHGNNGSTLHLCYIFSSILSATKNMSSE